ncbi:MAG: hypothetical protein AAF604_19460 [Acidobacteriota bacterium]
MAKKSVLFILCLALLAGSVGAQASPTLEEGKPELGLSAPIFAIEALRVEGNDRVSDEIVLSESRLTAGRSYAENELRQAAYRIARLPFIYSADFSLAKGSERGLYVLVIEVEETRRFFFGGDLLFNRFQPEVTYADDQEVDLQPTVGVRFFPGRHTLLYIATGGDNPGFGITRYRLFDRPALLNLSYARTSCEGSLEIRTSDTDDVIIGTENSECRTRIFSLGTDPAYGAWDQRGTTQDARFDLRLPIAGAHSVALRGSWLSGERGERPPVIGDPRDSSTFLFRDLIATDLELAWLYDTTDDPIFPARGQRLSAGLGWRTLEARLTRVSSPTIAGAGPATFDLPQTDSRELTVRFSGDRHWALDDRQTLSLGVNASLGRSRLDNFPIAAEVVDDNLGLWRGQLSLRHTRSLLDPQSARRWGELRWETTLQVGHSGTTPSLGVGNNPVTTWTAHTGLALRNRWGLFRVGFAFTHAGDRE